MYGADVVMTNRCMLEVWRLMRDDSVVVACVDLLTRAEHSLWLGKEEWALLGYAPLEGSKPRDQAADAQDMCAALRIVSSGNLRVEAATRLAFKGRACISGVDALVSIWHAPKRSSLIVQAVEAQSADAHHVLRVPEAHLKALYPRLRAAGASSTGSSSSLPEEALRAACALVLGCLYFAHSPASNQLALRLGAPAQPLAQPLAEPRAEPRSEPRAPHGHPESPPGSPFDPAVLRSRLLPEPLELPLEAGPRGAGREGRASEGRPQLRPGHSDAPLHVFERLLRDQVLFSARPYITDHHFRFFCAVLCKLVFWFFLPSSSHPFFESVFVDRKHV